MLAIEGDLGITKADNLSDDFITGMDISGTVTIKAKVTLNNGKKVTMKIKVSMEALPDNKV